MILKIASIDAVQNKSQIEVTDSAHSVYLKVDNVAAYDTLNVKAELVSKNRPNQVLYDLPLKDLHEKVLQNFFPQIGGFLIPLAVNDNLTLSADNKILLTLSWTAAQNITTIEYGFNTVATNTYSPLVVKALTLNGETDINTEYFRSLILPPPANVKYLEQLKNGVKIYKNSDLIKASVIPDLLSTGLPFFAVDLHETIKVDANGTAYLIQY
ncbi:hypothetical protein CMU40_18450 [Elizabethkingia anophelis]|nr:hypothetical protein [Elizabethkingia anophelis]MDV3728163.1 hypothetical protein [Elizabethkingia anophelis]MDV3731870.1 hypothetical protein [Elizabethkingia anophelis]MDV3746178.1 hypothetical protein [Elizabethkingia anophelis]MDV3767805.1 hypothetical protein [Elizabethkingia anophelis]